MNNMKKIAGVVFTAGAVLCSSSIFSDASAADKKGLYRCDDSTYGIGKGGYYDPEGGGAFNNAGGVAKRGQAAYLYNYYDCIAGSTANASGTVVTAQATLRAATRQLSNLVGNRINARMASNGSQNGVAVSANGFSASTGVAAGGIADRLGVWTSGRYTKVEDDNISTAFDGELYTVLVGADYKIDDRILVGLSGGYENMDLDTQFNKAESLGLDGSLEADGWVVAPYASYKVDEIFSVKLSGGYSWLDYDSVRYEAGSDQRVTGSTDSTRYYVEVGGNAAYAIQEWRLRGGLSYFYAREEKDSYTESDGTAQADLNTNLSQIRGNTELGYVWSMFEPYAKVGFEYDAAKSKVAVSRVQTTPEDDDLGVIVGGGLRLFAAPNITGVIEGNTVTLRDNYTEHNAIANIRVDF